MLDRPDHGRGESGNASGAMVQAAVASWFGPPPGHGQRTEPGWLLVLAWRHRRMVAMILGAGLVLGVLATLMQAPRYVAAARIEIAGPPTRVLADMDVVARASDLRALETAKEKLKGRDLARRVVDELALADNAAFLSPQPDFSLGNVLVHLFGLAQQPSLDGIEESERHRRALERVIGRTAVVLLRGTSLLEVRFVDADPELASLIANQLVRSFSDQQVDRTIEASERARQFLTEQAVATKARLEASETALVAYSRDQGLGMAGEDGALIDASIAAINVAIGKVVQERLSRERLVAQIDAGQAGRMEAVLRSDTVRATRTRLTELRAQYQQMLGTYRPEYPQMRQLRAQLEELEQQLQLEVDIIADAIRLAHQAAVEEELVLGAKLAELEREQGAFRDSNIGYAILKREVESNRAQYQRLVDRHNELRVAADVRGTNVEIADLAVPPERPSGPSLFRTVLMALGAAMVAGVAAVYMRELLDNRFTSAEQVESDLNLPVLGTIPLSYGVARSLGDRRSALSEAYRSLRTSLQFAGEIGPPSMILVTSTDRGESKSTSACKLAEEFAAIGTSVLVIDCNLRHPNLHRSFRVDGARGLTNLLTDTVARRDVPELFHRPAVQPNVTVLPAGPMVANPADLLSSPQMSSILQGCSQVYQLVILDGPEVADLSDALVLSRLTEATLFVVAGETARRDARVALKRLRSAGGNVLGIMLGKVAGERAVHPPVRRTVRGYGEAISAAARIGRPAATLRRFYERHLRPGQEQG